MFVQRKPYLRQINRVRVSEGRNLTKGLRLDRNERVDSWPKDFLSKIFSERPDYFLSVYPESTSLYAKLSKFVGVSEDELMLASGIDGVLKTIFEIMTEPGDTVGVLSPTYAMYQVYSNLFQTKLIEIGYKPDLSLDKTALNACIEQKPSVVFLPNPNQPIESSLTLRELKDLAEKMLNHNILFVVDEAYFGFGSETAVPLVKDFENVVVTRTFSKAFGVPSIRLGYLVASVENMKTLSKTRFAHESNALSNAVAEYLLDHYELVKNYNDQVVEARSWVKQELGALDIQAYGKTGNYLLIDLKSQENAAKYVQALREQLIYVKGPWTGNWNKYITITIGPKPSMDRFINAVKELKAKGR